MCSGMGKSDQVTDMKKIKTFYHSNTKMEGFAKI